MIKFLNKRFPTDNFPKIIVHLYYLMISVTFCYLYYHKFINRADFYGRQSSGGIYAVLNFDAIKPIQFRILIPFLFKAIQSAVFLFHPIGDKLLFFLITIMICYSIQVAFRFILNEYFQSGSLNNWLASVIIYPMIWNFVIMNGQFFYMDFSVLLIIILGFYFIIKEKSLKLLLVFLIGIFNHPSVGYLIPIFLLYNYRALLKSKTIIYTLIMAVLYIGIYRYMDYIFPSQEGYFILFNLPRNLSLYELLPAKIILIDLVFNFGGLHIFVIIFFFSGLWKRYMSPMLA